MNIGGRISQRLADMGKSRAWLLAEVPCPGYQVDHIMPLCAGGADSPANMHWLSIEDHRRKTANDLRHCRRQ